MTASPGPPSSVMYLSVDMVRSKQLKTAYMRRRESWLPLFRDLFETFPLIFVGRVALRFDDEAEVPEYRVWKTLGDEIVFSAPVPDGWARILLLAAFHDAVVQFDGRNKSMGGYGVKGCAWNVVLDGVNETIAIPEMASSDGAAYEDVIGPDVDFGFVLSKHGRDGQTVIDAGLAGVIEVYGRAAGLGVVEHDRVETPFRIESTANTFLLASHRLPDGSCKQA
jgi:hypothetical protein